MRAFRMNAGAQRRWLGHTSEDSEEKGTGSRPDRPLPAVWLAWIIHEESWRGWHRLRPGPAGARGTPSVEPDAVKEIS